MNIESRGFFLVLHTVSLQVFHPNIGGVNSNNNINTKLLYCDIIVNFNQKYA